MGNGRSILVSTHKWLPHKPVFLGADQPQLLVSDLIDSATMQWDREKIFDLFAHPTRMEILAIPLPMTTSRDKLLWKENSANMFTVRSAYQVALKLKESVQAEHSRAVTDRAVWKKIWTLHVPPKVRMFVWRACSNILPTRENLHRRKIKVDPQCEVCCQKTESTGHLLWECPLARNVWALCRGKIQKCSNDAQDFFALFQMQADRLTKMELDRWATISWAIWNARNKFYFEKIQQHPKAIMEGAIG